MRLNIPSSGVGGVACSLTKGWNMAVTKFAQHGLVRLGYDKSGEGSQTVLVLHGLLQDRVSVRPLLDVLEERVTVITMDLRGHGGSSAVHGLDMRLPDLVDDAFAVLDAAEIDAPVVVVGVELGAVIATGMKAAHPDRVRDLLLVNYPSGEMLDTEVITAIADRAYKGQAEEAVTGWLDLSWKAGWRDSVPKPRVAAARRSAEAIHPMLTALAHAEIGPQDSLDLPGGTPFAEEGDLALVVTALESLLDSE